MFLQISTKKKQFVIIKSVAQTTRPFSKSDSKVAKYNRKVAKKRPNVCLVCDHVTNFSISSFVDERRKNFCIIMAKWTSSFFSLFWWYKSNLLGHESILQQTFEKKMYFIVEKVSRNKLEVALSPVENRKIHHKLRCVDVMGKLCGEFQQLNVYNIKRFGVINCHFTEAVYVN